MLPKHLATVQVLGEGRNTVGPTEFKLWVLGEHLCVPVQVLSGCVVSNVAQPEFNKHYTGLLHNKMASNKKWLKR